MDEEKLRQQYEQTGNLLDLLNDPATMREVMHLESACGDIGAGFPAYSSHPNPVMTTQATAALRQVRLHSMVLSDLADLIQSIDLGAGTEAAITEGRQRIRQHLTSLTHEQRAYFKALVDEDLLHLSDKPVRAQLRSVIRSMLTASDWNAIEQAANAAQLGQQSIA
jgi:hypothetical protein